MALNPADRGGGGTIPGGWNPVTLGSVGKWLSGGTPSMRNEAYWSGDIPWISPKDMKVVRLTEGVDHISQQAVMDGARVLPPGAVLVVVRGMILAHSFPVAVADRSLSFNQDIKAVVPTERVDSDFLLYWLISNAERLRSLTTESTHGTRRLPTESLFSERVLLPGVAEQREIARAMRDTDALIESLEQLLAKKRDLKQGAMQVLLTGKKRLPGFESTCRYQLTELGALPKEWSVSALGGYLRRTPTYGINAAAAPLDSRLPAYVRITDITEDGRFSEDSRASVADSEAADYMLEEGDIVFARTGASVGKSYLYRLQDGPLVFAGFLIRISPDPQRLVPAFLSYFVHTRPYWNWVRVNSMRSGQPGINGREYATLPVPLPTRAEQEAIASVLIDMDAEIAALEAKLTKARQIKQGMMQELLTGRIRLV